MVARANPMSTVNPWRSSGTSIAAIRAADGAVGPTRFGGRRRPDACRRACQRSCRDARRCPRLDAIAAEIDRAESNQAGHRHRWVRASSRGSWSPSNAKSWRSWPCPRARSGEEGRARRACAHTMQLRLRTAAADRVRRRGRHSERVRRQCGGRGPVVGSGGGWASWRRAGRLVVVPLGRWTVGWLAGTARATAAGCPAGSCRYVRWATSR